MRISTWLGGVSLGAAAAGAETPAPFPTNVDRVVVSCEFQGDVPPASEASLCQQLVRKAQQVTELPVVTGAASAPGPGDLHIHLNGVAREVERGRKSLSLYAVPARSTQSIRASASTISTVTLQQVRDDWLILGPVDIFTKTLGSVPRRPCTPIASE